MKRVLLFGAGLALCAALYAAEDGARVADDAWMKAIKANDLEAVVAVYADDATLYPPDQMEAKGKEATRANYARMLGANTIQDVKFTERHYKTVGGVSMGWGRVSLTMAPKSGGAPVTLEVRYNEIAVKRGGKWLYLVDHASAPLPPPPASK